MDHSGMVVAAMSIAGPVFRLTEDKIPAVARSVIRAASELSVELGYKETRPEKKSAEVEPIKAGL
jgi:DNA-binding IclR family transcriptional regulator